MRTSYSAWQDIRSHYDDGSDYRDIESLREEWDKQRTCAKCGAFAMPVYVTAGVLDDPEPLASVNVVDSNSMAEDDDGPRLCPTCLTAFWQMFKEWLTASSIRVGCTVRRRKQPARVKSTTGVVQAVLATGVVVVRWNTGDVSRKYLDELEMVS